MSDSLRKFVERFDALRVAVLGDLMLDRYIWGEATRISQEAPVPVVLVGRDTAVPGGAANVVRNVLSLKAGALAAGLLGDDSDGEILLGQLKEAGADVAAVHVSSEVPTTVKTRILAGNQQVVRVDREQPGRVTAALRERVLSVLSRQLADGEIAALILEDYAKGLFDCAFMEKIVALAARHNVFVTLDPHPAHAFNVRGLRLMTPNRQEAFRLAGVTYLPAEGRNPLEDKPLLAVADRLMELWAPELLLVTLGAGGMMLVDRKGGVPIHIPTQAKQVFDVSGAGDTVMATMTLALLAGAAPDVAACIANHAAGVVVGFIGTRAIRADELLAVLP